MYMIDASITWWAFSYNKKAENLLARDPRLLFLFLFRQYAVKENVILQLDEGIQLFLNILR